MTGTSCNYHLFRIVTPYSGFRKKVYRAVVTVKSYTTGLSAWIAPVFIKAIKRQFTKCEEPVIKSQGRNSI